MGGAGGGSGGEVVSGVGTETGQSQREGRGKKCEAACMFFFSVSRIQTGKSLLCRTGWKSGPNHYMKAYEH